MSDKHVCPPSRTPIQYTAVVVDHWHVCVLVRREGSKIAFPYISSPEIPHRGAHMSECFSQKLEELTGTRYELVLLYTTISETYQRHIPGMHKVMFESLGPIDPTDDAVSPASTEYKWMGISEILEAEQKGALSFTEELDGFALDMTTRGDRQDFREDGVRPWEVAGWFKKTTDQAKSTLVEMGYTVTGPFEQHQISQCGAVLRVNTDKGRLFLKASTRKESATMKIAAGFAPHLVAQPLHVNAEQEWMLMEDYGSTLRDRFSREDFVNMLQLHGKLQVESVKHVSELTEAGVQREGLESIMGRTQKLLDDPEIVASLGEWKKFEVVDKSGKPDMEKCKEGVLWVLKRVYEDEKLPLALVHGDLYDDNMIKTERGTRRYTVYDWGSARIDVPFSDVMFLETEVRDAQEGDAKIGIDRYLELWSEYGSVAELKELCKYVSLKDGLMKLLPRYEYAKEWVRHPPLKERDMGYLCKTVEAIYKSHNFIR